MIARRRLGCASEGKVDGQDAYQALFSAAMSSLVHSLKLPKGSCVPLSLLDQVTLRLFSFVLQAGFAAVFPLMGFNGLAALDAGKKKDRGLPQSCVCWCFFSTRNRCKAQTSHGDRPNAGTDAGCAQHRDRCTRSIRRTTTPSACSTRGDTRSRAFCFLLPAIIIHARASKSRGMGLNIACITGISRSRRRAARGGG
jgi:hypothetical protein